MPLRRRRHLNLSCYTGRLELVYEITTAGFTIQLTYYVHRVASRTPGVSDSDLSSVLAPQQQKQKHDSALEKKSFQTNINTIAACKGGDPVSHSLMDCLERGLRVQVLVQNRDQEF
ncbi:hypothetical protein D9758_016145 [Tetrapyrgos nigripes]|uniref:Uncharacterized protein n=1 Tax=Tetrapyrgos nigripes TaxID=182062 RepID=A0A8H5FIC1_9AGAR|nr:hypothetical protein D9758_016145 [Tetrapyrgos nigripes]